MNNRSFGNPSFSGRSFTRGHGENVMTRKGVAVWLAMLIAILLGTGAFTWHQAFKAFGDFDFSMLERVEVGVDDDGEPITAVRVHDKASGRYLDPPEFDLGSVSTLMWVGIIGGFIVAMICIFNKGMAMLLAPIYAGLEGFALGGISAIYEVQFGGIVMQAAALSVAAMLAMYLVFVTGLIKVTPGLTVFITVCVLAVVGVYIVDMLLQASGSSIGIIHSTGLGGIAFSVVVCLLATFCFLVDFETIEEGIRTKADKTFEAYCAFSILVTLVWLYLEILRLLAKARSNR